MFTREVFFKSCRIMVGEKGTVIGIDILPTPALPQKNVKSIDGGYT